MAKTNKMLWIILGALGIGVIFLLRKPSAVARAPARVGVPVPGVGVAPTAPAPLPAGCEGQMILLAEQQLGLPREELTVRGLRPDDLGLGSTWSMNLAVANSWNTTVSTNVGDNRFICLKSVSYQGTDAEAIRIIAGGSVVLETNIQRIPGITTTHTASIRNVIVEQNNPITIQVYASAVSATDTLIISGTVVEKRGMVLA